MHSTTRDPLAYYATIGASLFPIPAGQKNPTGIVGSFAKDCSTDSAQWAAWRSANPGCNFGIVAGPSRLIIVDTDAKDDREAAWSARCALFAEWGVDPAAMPHVQSARGGWHDLFAVPADVDASTLRQPDAIKKLINVRAGNGFVVAAGSYYDGTAKGEASGAYILLSDAPPHPAPAALVAHCTRAAPRPATGGAQTIGTRDRGDVAALIHWLVEREQFAAYEDWVGVGMALKLEFGDEGLELWQLTHDATVDADTEAVKWQSFATEPAAGTQTLNTWLQRAHNLGWRGTVRKSTSALFEGVAALARNAGATLSAGTPLPAAGGVPMLAGQEVLAEFARPILADFLTATADAPARPINSDFPTLPEASAGHALYGPLRDAIARVMAMAEMPGFKGARCVDALAVLSLVHPDVFDSVCRRLRVLGATLPDRKIKLAASGLADKVEREFVKQDDWLYDPKGFIESDNSDNVAVFLGILDAEIRWNGWYERAEIRGWQWPEWTYIDDNVVAKLRTRGNRTKTRFKPGKDFFWESIVALAQQNTFDPARNMLDNLATEWDGTPRLMLWLSMACGVPCDPYHQSVSRNIIGGMVRRIREPGCKHDFMPVFYGPQGTGKSTMARMLAVIDAWFSDEIMLGDSSKELVLSLAGKSVVEVSEMGMRGSANPNHVKAMLSRQIDRGRTAYARTVTDRPRRNIFIGTTNDDEPLVDPTGNRRFLPVRVDREIDSSWLSENVRQIVGEAAAKHASGDDFAIPREVWSDAAERQEAARSAGDVETMLSEWFAGGEHVGPVSYVYAADLVRLMSLAGWRNGGATSIRAAVMKKLGFANEAVIVGGRRTRMWTRRPADVRPVDVARIGVRYMVGTSADGWPRVEIRHSVDDPTAPVLPPIGSR